MRKKDETKLICSMDEFEKRFYPKSHEKKKAEQKDEQQLGSTWAKESIDKIRKEL